MEHIYNSPLGKILITYDETYILGLCFDDESNKEQSAEHEYHPGTVISQCIAQLDEYFGGTRLTFNIATNPRGTDFQKSVWTALCTIRCGKTASYGQIAAQIGSPRAARAVGMANNKNPIYIIIPCHRVVGANGKLVGYGGGLWRKEWLLEHEAKTYKKLEGQL